MTTNTVLLILAAVAGIGLFFWGASLVQRRNLYTGQAAMATGLLVTIVALVALGRP